MSDPHDVPPLQDRAHLLGATPVTGVRALSSAGSAQVSRAVKALVPTRQRVRSLAGPITTLALASAVWMIALSKPPAHTGESLDGVLNSVIAKSIDITVDRAKLYVSWALALVAAVGFAVKTLFDGDFKLTRRELFFAEAAAVCGVISIIFGELVISNILTMLDADQFKVEDPLIVRYSNFQYGMLLSGLTCILAFVHEFFWRWQREQTLADSGPVDRDHLDASADTSRDGR